VGGVMDFPKRLHYMSKFIYDREYAFLKDMEGIVNTGGLIEVSFGDGFLRYTWLADNGAHVTASKDMKVFIEWSLREIDRRSNDEN
jgi:hypothetical protein